MMEGVLKKAAKQNVDGCHLIMDHEDLDRNSGAAMTMHAIFSSLPSRWGIEVFTLHPLFFQASERASEREREREEREREREGASLASMWKSELCIQSTTESWSFIYLHNGFAWLCISCVPGLPMSPYVAVRFLSRVGSTEVYPFLSHLCPLKPSIIGGPDAGHVVWDRSESARHRVEKHLHLVRLTEPTTFPPPPLLGRACGGSPHDLHATGVETETTTVRRDDGPSPSHENPSVLFRSL